MVKQLNTICLFGYFVTAEVMKLPMKYAMIKVDELKRCLTKWQDLSWYFTEQTEKNHEISENRQLVPEKVTE